MCGRYSWLSGWDVLEERFALVGAPATPAKPRYNAAPGQLLPIITNENPKHVTLARWGLVPFWAKDKRAGIINARAETVGTKPAFRRSFSKRRCLVPADSFFEWQGKGRVKIPYRILMANDAPLAFAGIWEPGDETTPATYTIITTTPNELVAKIHDRMPVILEPSLEQVWLHPNAAGSTAAALVKPYPARSMRAYPVGKIVNAATNNTPEVLEPAA